GWGWESSRRKYLPHLWGSTRPSRGMGLGVLPTPKLLLLIHVGEGLALAAQRGFGRSEALAKSLPRDSKSVFRIHLQASRQGDDCEQEIAELVERALPVGDLGQLPHFFRDRLGRGRRRREIKPDPCRPLLQAKGPREGGQAGRHAVDDRFLAARVAGLVHLLVLPVAQHLFGV